MIAALPASAMIGGISGWLARRRPEILLSLRMTIAGLAAFAAAHLLGLTQVYWAVLTAVIVMQASVGGSLKASIDRFFGTLGGAGWGVAVSVAVPHPTVLAMGLALAVALIPLAVVVAFWPRYRIAPVTAAIVLLGTPGPSGVFGAAFDRVLEIGLGSLVALAVAVLVSPSQAHQLLFEAARDALALMRDQVDLLLAGVARDIDAAAMLRLNDRIRATIERANTVADEVARERASHLADAPDPEPFVRNLRRLSHDLVMIGRAVATALPDAVASRLAEPGAQAATALGECLVGIGEALVHGAAPPSLDPVAAALAGYGAAMEGLRSVGITRALPGEDVERVFGLAFALEQMRRNLEELANRVREVAPVPSPC